MILAIGIDASLSMSILMERVQRPRCLLAICPIGGTRFGQKMDSANAGVPNKQEPLWQHPRPYDKPSLGCGKLRDFQSIQPGF